MPDITMCQWGDCPLKEKCYRYNAEPSEYQLMFTEVPYEENKDCEYFWETSK